MTRLFHAGAEGGHVHVDDLSIGNTVTVDSGTKRSGAFSYKCDSAAGNTAAQVFATAFTQASGTTWYVRAWFNIPAAPSADAIILEIVSPGTTSHVAVQLKTDRTLVLLNAAGSVWTSSSTSAAVSTSTWFSVAVAYTYQSAGNETVSWQVDDVAVDSGLSAANTNAASPSRVTFGWPSAPGANKVIYVDDIILNDNQGTANLSWPFDEKVVMLLPTADSERDGWTGGAGGTTNLFEAVNNTPPAGLDSGSSTDTSQIEAAASDTTDNYNATMTTYTAAGIGASDLITAVYAVIEGGNDSTTGTDTVGVSVISTPAIGETMVNVDVNDGTYPTGWNRGATAISENPSIPNRGTAPVMSVRKGVATTRDCQVCFMGMSVSYLPDPTSAPTGDVIATEAFTDSAGTLLQTHSADWTRDDPFSTGTPADAVITDDNRLRIEDSPPIAIAYYRNTGNAPVSANYAVSADMIPDSVSGYGGTLIARGTGTGGYAARLDADVGTVTLETLGGVTLGTSAQTYVADQVYAVELRCHDDYKAVLVDGVLRLLSLDNSITAAGHAGLGVADAAGGSNTTSVQLDNWEAQDYDTAGGGPTAVRYAMIVMG